MADQMVNRVIAYEQGELTKEEEIELFQELVDSGVAWLLQGHYGRTAVRMINDGLVVPDETAKAVVKRFA
jgi:hypothetical protein